MDQVLLICTVGGAPEPLIASIKHWRPQRLIFLPSHDTKGSIEETIIPRARQEGADIPAGCCDIYPVPDHQDFSACVRKMKERNEDVERWLGRGDEYQVVVDFTGGTKCMTAALALTARLWRCSFSYVGGDRRTKEEVGVVVSGREQIMHTQNPWDVLGYQAVEEAVILCERGAHASAAAALAEVRDKITEPTVKHELATLTCLAEACAAWDRFDHNKARECLKNVKKNINDFLSLFGPQVKEHLSVWVDRQLDYLKDLKEKTKPTPALIFDLLANAKRRYEERRFDDAVARIYRAIEALAQLRLLNYGIEKTGKVPLDKIPEPLKSQWADKAKEGLLKLGLQDDYALLQEYGDDLADVFSKLNLSNGEETPLSARNNSIWSHGFELVSEKTYRDLWKAVIELAQIREEDLPHFPRLTGGGG